LRTQRSDPFLEIGTQVRFRPGSDPAGIYRLKNEFRALADVSHTHLVRLHELFAADGLWYFSMDLVDGLPFDAWVRPGRALDERRLRAALPQLLDGILAIHQAGKLHRDLKPSNVLVTPDGRVVVLDFGLASDLAASSVGPTLLEDRYDGTPAYMAPEQAAGEAASAASDFYALGVMLFKALTGELPFTGRSFEILKMKQARAAPPVTEENPHAPEDLVAVCAALLKTTPNERPSGDSLSQSFGRAMQLGAASMRDWNAPRGLVGRETDLLALRAAYAASCDGDKPVVVLLSGESGIGKSALIESFLRELRESSGCSVLSGRCYERENVPFNAFDPVIDELSRHLAKLSSAERAAVIPPAVHALRRLFPVLGRSEAVAEAKGGSVPDAFELRRQGFSELGEIFGRLRDRQPLVIAIDDLQWGDQDSATLLLHLLRQPDAARMLVIVAHRSEGMPDNPVLAMLYEAADGDPRFDARPLALAPLATEAAALLVGVELGDAAPALLREAGGNPFLLHELAGAASVSNRTSLGEILRARVLALPDGERALLEVLSVAARPLSLQLAAAAPHAALPARAAFDALRSAHLARSSVQPGSIECYHDRVRESVAAGLSADTRRSYHSALAQQLVQSPDADPEQLAEHFEQAGEPLRAAEYAASAANHAADGFAFAQAARLYDKALSLGSFSEAETQRLRVALADALAHGGGGRLAAEAYLRAAQGTRDLGALELESSAAALYVGSGAVARGRELTRDILSSLGLRAPGSPVSAIATLVLERAWMRLRGSHDFVRHVRRVDPEQERRLEALQRAVTALAQVDMLSVGHWFAFRLRSSLRYAAGLDATRPSTNCLSVRRSESSS
jgi:serine/threonine protein kinase